VTAERETPTSNITDPLAEPVEAPVSAGRKPVSLGARGDDRMRRRQRSGVRLGLAAAVLAMACAPGDGGPAPADLDLGRALFRGTCATCHGANGEGMPRLGKDLRADAFVRGRSDAQLVEFLKEGRPANHPENLTRVDMPPRGGNPALTDEDLAAIVAYLRSL
jgi:disulfide bond formation protein DsbB